MKTNSIFFKIRIAFAISSFLILAVFAMFYFIQKHYDSMELRERLMHASRIAKHLTDEPQEANERLRGLELDLVGEESAAAIMDDLNKKELHLPGPAKIFTLEKGSKNYILMMHPKGSVVFLDKKPHPPIHLFLLAALAAVLAVLSLFYRSILEGLTPLETLKTKIEEFKKEGKFEPPTKPMPDEIASLSKAFEDTAKHLSDISKARSLFLRNIAHELKTPLSKGRFLTEMVENEETKERLHALFADFDALINELLQVERLTASGINLNKKEYRLQDILDEAIESGSLDDEQISVEGDGESVNVDFRLFALAIKNLLTNAVKYSPDGKASVSLENKAICVSNVGTPMPRPPEQLVEPFVKGDESSEGLGLGLYIVRQILEAHGVKLDYGYNNGIHTFKIDLGNLT